MVIVYYLSNFMGAGGGWVPFFIENNSKWVEIIRIKAVLSSTELELELSLAIFKDIIQIEVDPPPSHPILKRIIWKRLLTGTVPVNNSTGDGTSVTRIHLNIRMIATDYYIFQYEYSIFLF